MQAHTHVFVSVRQSIGEHVGRVSKRGGLEEGGLDVLLFVVLLFYCLTYCDALVLPAATPTEGEVLK